MVLLFISYILQARHLDLDGCWVGSNFPISPSSQKGKGKKKKRNRLNSVRIWHNFRFLLASKGFPFRVHRRGGNMPVGDQYPNPLIEQAT